MNAYDLANAGDRFWAKVERGIGCWPWTAGKRNGYGHFNIRTRTGSRTTAQAHRLAYELLVGPIPDGLTIDHLCRNRACVNPDHLEPVTNRENILRGEAPTVRLYRSGLCKRGHPLGDAHRGGGGLRGWCKSCKRAYNAAHRDEQRAYGRSYGVSHREQKAAYWAANRHWINAKRHASQEATL